MEKIFPIGFWNYWHSGDFGPEEIGVWADCGITVTMSYIFSYGSDPDSEMFSLLDAAQARGIKLILWIDNLSYNHCDENGEFYRKLFKKVNIKFGSHPAAYGFFIGDEPSTAEQFETCRRAVRIQREIAPELRPYVNLHTNMDDTDPQLLGGMSFRPWLVEFVKDTGLQAICYGHYDQMTDDTGIESYYKNLKALSEAAEGADIDLWNTMLSSAHYLFRVPNEYDLGWQISTAVAGGSRGIIWFRFYDKIAAPNYHGSPIDENRNKSATYTAMARVHNRFNTHYGALFMSLRRKATYHFGKTLGGYPLFEEGCHKYVRGASCRQGLHGILSFFEDETEREYLVMVNGSQTKPGAFDLDYDKNKIALEEILYNGKHAEPYEIGVDGIWLYPGQLTVFRLKSLC